MNMTFTNKRDYLEYQKKHVEEYEKSVEENMKKSMNDNKDNVNHPSHYQGSSIEVIDIIEEFDLNFHLGNAIKYILRAGKKGDDIDGIDDLKKALWYIRRELDNQMKPHP